MSHSRIIVALDFPTSEAAMELAVRLDSQQCRVKIGKELFTLAGPGFVEKLMKQGFDVFLDLKFHDIPNTVAAACRAAANLGVWMVNVHAFGGRKMLLAAREALADTEIQLIAVTLLTSLNQDGLHELGITDTPEIIVQRLALLAQDCGLDGVVCSAQEAAQLRKKVNQNFCLVTPGIRFPENNSDDQARVTTPELAIAHGADYLVVGRPITRAPDPLQALQRFNEAVTSAL